MIFFAFNHHLLMFYPGMADHSQNLGADNSEPAGGGQLPNLGQHGDQSSLPVSDGKVPETDSSTGGAPWLKHKQLNTKNCHL